MKQISIALAGLMLAFAAPATADRAATIEEYLNFQQQVRANIEDGVYGRMSADEIELIAGSQQTLDRLLRGKSSIDELNEDERMAVYNAQEAIIAVLTDTVDNRPICRRRHTVGSHRPVTECFTPRERRELSDRARDAARYWQGVQASSGMAPPTDG